MRRITPRRDRRARATGRLGVAKGERYALLPDDLLRSAAVCELSGIGFRVLVAFAAQYHGRNNGSLTLPASAARDYGIRSKAQLVAGVHECLRHQLLELTYQGGLPPLGCSRYAVTWKQVDANVDFGLTRCPAGNAWASWRPDPSTADRRKQRRDRMIRTPVSGRDQCRSLGETSTVRNGPALVSGRDQYAQLLVSGRDPSKILGPGGERGAPERTRARPPSGHSGSKIRHLIDSMPGVTDNEVAKILSVDIDQVREARHA